MMAELTDSTNISKVSPHSDGCALYSMDLDTGLRIYAHGVVHWWYRESLLQRFLPIARSRLTIRSSVQL